MLPSVRQFHYSPYQLLDVLTSHVMDCAKGREYTESLTPNSVTSRVSCYAHWLPSGLPADPFPVFCICKTVEDSHPLVIRQPLETVLKRFYPLPFLKALLLLRIAILEPGRAEQDRPLELSKGLLVVSDAREALVKIRHNALGCCLGGDLNLKHTYDPCVLTV